MVIGAVVVILSLIAVPKPPRRICADCEYSKFKYFFLALLKSKQARYYAQLDKRLYMTTQRYNA